MVADAYTRDTLAIIDLRFPTFIAGVSPLDSLGRIDVEALDVAITCGGVTVEPDDLVVGDHDGVVVIPRALAPDVVARAEAKTTEEDLVREELARGASVAGTFKEYGVI